MSVNRNGDTGTNNAPFGITGADLADEAPEPTAFEAATVKV